MKKSVFAIVALVGLIAFSSCKKTTGGSSTSATAIIGTWEAKSLTTTTTAPGYPPITYDTTFTHGHSVIEIFNADGTGGIIDQRQTPADTTMGTYYVSNDSTYTKPTGDLDYTFGGTFSVSGNTLTIVNGQSFEGVTETGTLVLNKQ